MVQMSSKRFVNGAAAHDAAVTKYMDNLTFEMLSLAQELLVQHKFDGDAQVSREKDYGGKYGALDYYIVLSDERGQLAALSIEYGHGEYTRRYRTKDGKWIEVTVPKSEGTYILTRATGIPRKGKG